MDTHNMRLHINEEEQATIAATIRSMTDLDHCPLPQSRDALAALHPQPMEDWVHRFGDLELEDVGGEGHCQFRVLAEVLLGDRELFREVRRAAAQWMLAHPDGFDVGAQHDVPASSPRYDSLRDFAQAIAERSEWGNHATLQAISDSWKVEIRVVSSLGGGTLFDPIVPSDGSDVAGVVHIAHYFECHYAVIRERHVADGGHMRHVSVDGQASVAQARAYVSDSPDSQFIVEPTSSTEPSSQVNAMPSPAVLPGVFTNDIIAYLEYTDNALQACQHQEIKRIEIDHIMKNGKVDAVVFGDTGCGMDEKSLRTFAIAAHHPGFQQAEEPSRAEGSAHPGRFVNYDLGVYGVGAKRCAFYMGNMLYVFTKKDKGAVWRLQMDYQRMRRSFEAGEEASDPAEAERLKTEAWRLAGLNSVTEDDARRELANLGVSDNALNRFLETEHGTLVVVNHLNEHFDFANEKNTDDVVAEILNSYGPTYIAQERVQFIVDEHEIPISLLPSGDAMVECYKASFYGCLPPECQSDDSFTFSIKPVARDVDEDLTTMPNRQVNVVAMYYPRRWSEDDKQIRPTAPWSHGPQYYVYYNGRLIHDVRLTRDSNPPILPGIAHVRDKRREADNMLLEGVAFYFFVTSGYRISQDKSSLVSDLSWIWDPQKATYEHPRNPKKKFWAWAHKCHEKYDNDCELSDDGAHCMLNGGKIAVDDVVMLQVQEGVSKAVVVRGFETGHQMVWFTYTPYFRQSANFEKELEEKLKEGEPTSKAIVYKINPSVSREELEQLKQSSDLEVRNSWPAMVVTDMAYWDEWLAGRNRDNYAGYDIPPGGDVEMIAGQKLTLPTMTIRNSTSTIIRKSLILGGLSIKAVLTNGDGDILMLETHTERGSFYIGQRPLTEAGEFTVEAQVESSLGYPVAQEPLTLKWNVTVRPSDADTLVTELPGSVLKVRIGEPAPEVETYLKDSYGNRIELEDKTYEINPRDPNGLRVEDGLVVGTFDDEKDYELIVKSGDIKSDPIPLRLLPGPAKIKIVDVPRRFYHGVKYTINGEVADVYGNSLRRVKVVAESERFEFKTTGRRGMKDRIEVRVDGSDFKLEFVPWNSNGDMKAQQLKLSVPGEECEKVFKIQILPTPKLHLVPVPDGLEKIGTGDGSTQDKPLVLSGRAGKYSLECECEESTEWTVQPDTCNISIGTTDTRHEVVASFQNQSQNVQAVLYLLLKPKGGDPVRYNLVCPSGVVAGELIDEAELRITAVDQHNLEATHEAAVRYTWASDDETLTSDECRAPKKAGPYTLSVQGGELESNEVKVKVTANVPRRLWAIVRDDHGEERGSGVGQFTINMFSMEKLSFTFEVFDEHENVCTDNVTRKTVELSRSAGIHGYRGSSTLGLPSTHTIQFARHGGDNYGVFKNPTPRVEGVRIDFCATRDEVSDIRMDGIQPEYSVAAGENNLPADLCSGEPRLNLLLENGEERKPPPDSVKLLLYGPGILRPREMPFRSLTTAGKYTIKAAYFENRPHHRRGSRTFDVCTVVVSAGHVARLSVDQSGITDANNSGSPQERLIVRPDSDCELLDQYGNKCWNSTASLNITTPSVDLEVFDESMREVALPLGVSRGSVKLPLVCVKEGSNAGNYELQFTVDGVPPTSFRFEIADTHSSLMEAQRRRERQLAISELRARIQGLRDEMESGEENSRATQGAIDRCSLDTRQLLDRIRGQLERHRVVLRENSQPGDYINALQRVLRDCRRSPTAERMTIPRHVQGITNQLVDVMGVEDLDIGNVLATLVRSKLNALVVRTLEDCRTVRRAFAESRKMAPPIYVLDQLPRRFDNSEPTPWTGNDGGGRNTVVRLASSLVDVAHDEYAPLRDLLFSNTIVLSNDEVEAYRRHTGEREGRRQILGYSQDKIVALSSNGLCVEGPRSRFRFGNHVRIGRELAWLDDARVKITEEYPRIIEEKRREIEELEVKIGETRARIDELEGELRVVTVQDAGEERPPRRQRRR